MRNDCQHHETQMGIRLESWELDPKWVLYNLLYTLGCAGYGQLHPEGVQKLLKKMVKHWKRRNFLNLVYFQLFTKIRKMRYDFQTSTIIQRIGFVFFQIKFFKISVCEYILFVCSLYMLYYVFNRQ